MNKISNTNLARTSLITAALSFTYVLVIALSYDPVKHNALAQVSHQHDESIVYRELMGVHAMSNK